MAVNQKIPCKLAGTFLSLPLKHHLHLCPLIEPFLERNKNENFWRLYSPIIKPNKRPMGHNTHLKKQFLAVYKFEQTIIIYNRLKKQKISIYIMRKRLCCYISPKKKAFTIIWRKLISPIPRMFVLSLVEIGPVVLEKRTFKSH